MPVTMMRRESERHDSKRVNSSERKPRDADEQRRISASNPLHPFTPFLTLAEMDGFATLASR